MIELFLFRVGGICGELGVEIKRALAFEEGGVYCEMHFVHRGSLVAVQEGSQFTLGLSSFPHLGDEDRFAPKFHEVDFAFGRVEQ